LGCRGGEFIGEKKRDCNGDEIEGLEKRRDGTKKTP
jgi:hypothetical protein